MVKHEKQCINSNLNSSPTSIVHQKNSNPRYSVQSGGKPMPVWQCGKCGVIFTRNENLKKHESQCKAKATGANVCLKCNKHFRYQRHLTNHQNKCTARKCEICEKVLPNMQVQIMHKRTCGTQMLGKENDSSDGTW